MTKVTKMQLRGITAARSGNAIPCLKTASDGPGVASVLPADSIWSARDRADFPATTVKRSANVGPVSRLERITSDPGICHGQPVVRGLRYPVQMLLELLSSGMTFDEVLDDYKDLERDDLLAALEYGARVVAGHPVSLGAA